VLLSLSTGKLNASDADFASLTFAAAQTVTAMQKYLSSAISQLPVLEENTILRVSGAFTRIATASLAMLRRDNRRAFGRRPASQRRRQKANGVTCLRKPFPAHQLIEAIAKAAA